MSETKTSTLEASALAIQSPPTGNLRHCDPFRKRRLIWCEGSLWWSAFPHCLCGFPLATNTSLNKWSCWVLQWVSILIRTANIMSPLNRRTGPGTSIEMLKNVTIWNHALTPNKNVGSALFSIIWSFTLRHYFVIHRKYSATVCLVYVQTWAPAFSNPPRFEEHEVLLL